MATNASDTVVLVLMKTEEADATVTVIQRDEPSITVRDHGTYWQLTAEGEIPIDLNRVGEELGRELSLSQWLVSMSSYVGRVETEQASFRVTSKMADLEPEAPC